MIKFSKITLLLMVSSVLVTPAQAQVQGDNWAVVKAKGSGSITLAYVEAPGLVYKDASGNLTGICVDIMKDFVAYVNKTKGVKLTSTFTGNGSSFSNMLSTVKSGKNGVFGIGNITITAARKKEFIFTPAFIRNSAILITHKTVPTLGTMSEVAAKFKGLTAYTSKGTMNEKRIASIKSKYLPSLTIKYAPSSPATMAKVVGDAKSFTYLDVAFYLDAVKNKKPLKRHAVGDTGSEEFGMVMPLSSDWGPLMEEFFRKDGG